MGLLTVLYDASRKLKYLTYHEETSMIQIYKTTPVYINREMSKKKTHDGRRISAVTGTEKRYIISR